MTEKEYKKLTFDEFESAAEKFDDNDPSVYNMCRRDYPEVLEEVKKEKFTDLLDAGCGTGAMIGLFCEDIKGKSYTGIDLSNKMIEVANRRNLDNATFIVGDCEALPFENDSFDVVTCSMSFHHYPSPEKFFLNLNRVLRPGGRFILRDMASNSALLMKFFNKVELPTINKLCKKGDVHCYTRKDMELLCKGNGLLLESYEVRKGFRLHCVVRKAKS